MEQLRIDAKETRELFILAFRHKNLVPILGAGFSKGLPTKKSLIPDGKSLKSYMIDMIIRKNVDITRTDLEKEDFSFVAGLFEKKYEEIDEVKDYFINNFTGVKFPECNKKRFLNEINWDYIYTLNIDSAIENSSNEWEIFYPNRKFIDENVSGKKKLYKIHGDVNMFCKSKNYDEMILTDTQYIGSLEENSQFHNKLAADCGGKNLLYLGCSLDDEIDIKYSALSDKNKNNKDMETYRIYITSEKLTGIKIAKLEGFNISHYIQLESPNEYEMLYEYFIDCYKESLAYAESNLSVYEYKDIPKLNNIREKNLEYLSNMLDKGDIKPYYYIVRKAISSIELVDNKINVFVGRRYSGKTLLSYNLLDYYRSKKKYFIPSRDSLDDKTFKDLLQETNSIIIFDSDAITEGQFLSLVSEFKEGNKCNNIICVMLNSYDELTNIISYHKDYIYEPFKQIMNGWLESQDITSINEILNNIDIAIFNPKQNLLDNTLRISNTYGIKVVERYSIDDLDELIMLIWISVKNVMYYEDVITLGLIKRYKKIVEKFGPFIQIEECKQTERKKHSIQKIVCNGKLGILQILGEYAYPLKSEMGNAVLATRLKNICTAIYSILNRFDKIDIDSVKKFLMFDTLNDVFSRQYSRYSIQYLVSEGKEGKKYFGASRIIKEIYESDNIKRLKSSDPNYWLQRAKSLYIFNDNGKRLSEGVDYALKAEEDSRTRCNNGEYRFQRTLSNATIQIAMLYGKIANLEKYTNTNTNTEAVRYYFRGMSDTGNKAAAKSLIANSKGTEDFRLLVNQIKLNKTIIDKSFYKEAEYLCNVSSENGFTYRL